jgi:hypothetical protein
MNEPTLEYLGEMRAELAAPMQVGAGPRGVRVVHVVAGGQLTGPKVNAKLLTTGGDWFLIRNDGSGELDVRVMLQLDDGQLAYVQYRGILLFTPEILERWGRGEAIPPEETYFRTTPHFETASEKYSWLNTMVVVGMGQLVPGGVCYQLYTVK